MVGLESREIVVTVSNTGTSALRLGGIELAGNDLQDFKLAPLSCRSQSILAPGDAVTSRCISYRQHQEGARPLSAFKATTRLGGRSRFH
jgi:hypothetical protein